MKLGRVEVNMNANCWLESRVMGGSATIINDPHFQSFERHNDLTIIPSHIIFRKTFSLFIGFLYNLRHGNLVNLSVDCLEGIEVGVLKERFHKYNEYVKRLIPLPVERGTHIPSVQLDRYWWDDPSLPDKRTQRNRMMEWREEWEWEWESVEDPFLICMLIRSRKWLRKRHMLLALKSLLLY